MTTIFEDQFEGTGSWSAANWSSAASSGGSFVQQDGRGVLRLGTAGNYNDKQQALTSASMTGGEYRYDLVIASKAEYTVAMMAHASGSVVNWTHMPQHGYWVRFLPVNGQMTLLRNNNYAQTTLASITLTVAVGDVVHVAIRPGVGAYAWKNGDPRPATPNLPSADSTYASGKGGIGAQGGPAGTAIDIPFEFAVMDDLVVAEPPVPVPRLFVNGPAGSFVPLRPSFPSGAATLLWEDDFDTLDLATAATVETARWRPNDFWQGINRGYEDFAGTSWNLNPNESLGGEPRSPFSVADSVLTIKAIRTPSAWSSDIAASMAAQGQTGGVPAWSGGMLITNSRVHKFKYGCFAIKARWPNAGPGMFPALWLYATEGSSDPGHKGSAEIDIFEVFGHAAGRPWSVTVHRRDNTGAEALPSIDVGTYDTDTAAWHVYAVDWQPGHLRFYKDDVQVAEITGSDAAWFDTTMSIRLNYSMDGSWFPVKSDGTTPDPLVMEVDYVRVWDRKPPTT